MESPPNEKGERPQRRNISLQYADLIFLACYFCSGLLDSTAYVAWTCFVSMQTGNTVFLGLGASGQPEGKPFGWLKSLTSIAAFLIGSFVFSFLSRNRTRHRLTLSLSFAAQALCIIISAALIQSRVISSVSHHESHGELLKPLVPLFLLAFQAGGQMAASRGCGFNELPTTVLTSVYYDISSDPKLTDGVTKNVKRNRRIAAGVFFVVGAIVGGWAYKGSNQNMGPALWAAAGIKVAGAVGWLFWKLED